MKTLLTLALILAIAVPVFAADGDITKVEVKPDVATYALDTVKFLVFTKTCEVTYRKVDAEGNNLGEDVKILFMNVEDDPETIDVDETDNSFSQLVTAINNNSNIKTTITNAVKIKLGL